MKYFFKKYWWLVLLAITVLTFKYYPDKSPVLEKSEVSKPTASEITSATTTISTATTITAPTTTSTDGNASAPVENNKSSSVPAAIVGESPSEPVARSKKKPAYKKNRAYVQSIKGTFPEWVPEQLSLLKSGMTLSEWKTSHPRDAVVLYSPKVKTNINIDTTWCAQTKAVVKFSDRRNAVRYAVFYPPAAPESFAFPAETNNMIGDGCTLGLIWIEQREPRDRQGNEIAVRVQNEMEQRFGEGQSGILNRTDAKYLSETGRWQKSQSCDEAVFISAYGKFPRTGKIIALGFLSVSGLQKDGGPPPDIYYEAGREYTLSRIREALQMSNLPEKDIDFFFKYLYDYGGRIALDSLQADTIVQFLERMIEIAVRRGKTGKSAVLIAADHLLAETQNAIGTTNRITGESYRQRLKRYGAKFEEPPLEEGFLYSRTWITYARDFDKGGPMGNLAFRILMDMGFSEGSMSIEEIIRQGEDYMVKNPAGDSRAEVEFMLAEAYRDVVALSSGAGACNERTESNAEIANDARQKAIEHYRNSLPLIKSNRLTREAWREAWRLIAGLPPAYLRYHCK